jgi:hypothetical protein
MIEEKGKRRSHGKSRPRRTAFFGPNFVPNGPLGINGVKGTT